MLTPEIARALEQIRSTFPGSDVTAREDGEGGAYVVIESVDLPAGFAQGHTWVGFRITFQYPLSDVYPLFVRGDLAFADAGRSVGGEGVQPNYEFEGRSAVQLSRRSNHLDPTTDTAALKVLKVMKWLG